MKRFILSIFIVCSFQGFAQSVESTIDNDSVRLLSPVVVKAFESGRSLMQTPVSVGYISQKDLQRFSTPSIIPAMNTIPGVRMEERSPGSYRLNIRGSLLRSPFGVRNLKVYWNDLPFTDAGGNTYLNLVEPATLSAIEVLKGPAGSMYGANTGGVLILHPGELPPLTSSADALHRFRVQASAGSFGTWGEQALWTYRDKQFGSTVSQGHLASDGYRRNSRLRKDVVQWNGHADLSDRYRLEWVTLYGDLYYQTPGGLTQVQLGQDPRQARTVAVDQKAAIYNKTIFAGITNSFQINGRWTNTTSVSFSGTDFKNPFITNFEKRKEHNLAVRSKFMYAYASDLQEIKVIAGAEWLYGDARIDNFGNRQGVPDTVQAKDKLWVTQWFPFVQFEWQWQQKLLVQLGASTNSNNYDYQRFTGPDNAKKTRTFHKQFLPRVALLYPFSTQLSVFASLSKGFSPATLAEIRSSDNSINTALQPEYGWNYEAGVRAATGDTRLQFEAALYYFRLRDAIVRRLNSSGAEYFINAGGTNQKGVEARLSYNVIANPTGFTRLLRVWSALTLNRYRFSDYRVDNADRSGNEVTGIPKRMIVSGIDFQTRVGLFLYASLNATSRLPLNDANTEYAAGYDLLQAKLGWKKVLGPRLAIETYLGGDNLLNEQYSLGNDINAFGNRYYNPAAKAGFMAGFVVDF